MPMLVEWLESQGLGQYAAVLAQHDIGLGDGIVAFFGFPLTHEGEAERAIHAGLEIIEAPSALDVPDAGHLAVRIVCMIRLTSVGNRGPSPIYPARSAAGMAELPFNIPVEIEMILEVK